MKVFHIRLEAPGYASDAIERAFKGFNIEYSYLNWQQFRFDRGMEAARNEMIGRAAEEKPDIIFCHIQNPEVFDIETAVELSKHGFVVNYTFDVRSKEKTRWMYDIARVVGLTCFACDEDVYNCLEHGTDNIMVLKSSCDTEIYKTQNLPAEVIKHYPEIVFIGNNTINTNLGFENAKQRVDMVEYLTKQYGSRFKAYGLGWNGSKMVYPMEEVNIYNACKIAITQNQFSRSGYCSDRQWRSMACGTMTICQHYRGIESDLYNSDLFYWETFADLKRLIDYYLKNDAERVLTAKDQQKDFLDNHTWVNRIAQMLLEVKELKTTNVQNTNKAN